MRTLMIACAAVVALGAVPPTSTRQAIPLAKERPAPREIEDLVRQALEDRLAANDIPDGKLLAQSPRIAVRAEMPDAQLTLGEAALPRREGQDAFLISVASAQADADRTGTPVHFIGVDGPSIIGETATISLGVDVVFPRDPKVVKLCCCTGRAEFARVGGRWTFVKWGGMVCS
jgi:hypothetical protein